MSGSKNEFIGFDRIVAAALFMNPPGSSSESKIGTSEAIRGYAVSYGDQFTPGRLLIAKSDKFLHLKGKSCDDSLHDVSLSRILNVQNVLNSDKLWQFEE
jgi:hypothetical protein